MRAVLRILAEYVASVPLVMLGVSLLKQESLLKMEKH